MKSALVLVLAAAAVGCMRRCSAAARHLVWFLAIASVLPLPVLSYALPGWRVLPAWMGLSRSEIRVVSASRPRPPETSGLRPVGISEAGAAETQPERASLGTSEPQLAGHTEESAAGLRIANPRHSRLPIGATTQPGAKTPTLARWEHWQLGLVGWLAGVILALVPTLLGLLSLWRLERGARRETELAWLDLLGRLVAALGFRRRVALLKSRHRRMPMTWGVLHPKVLLPEESQEWSEEKRRVVLLHELAHAKRWDYLTNLVTQLACAFYWFNPLVWLAARQMVAERERACDDVVLRHGAEPADYAEQVLAIAARLPVGRFAGLGAIPMARPSRLEDRLLAILDRKRDRSPLSRWAVLMSIALLAAVMAPVAMMKAVSPQADRGSTSKQAPVPARERLEPPDATPRSVPRQSVAKPTPGFISGHVVDDKTGEPISDFLVQTSRPNFQKPEDVFWNGSMLGNQQRPGLFSARRPTSNEVVRILAPGYVPQILTEQTVANQPASELEIRLKQGDALQGVVLDDSGRPVAGARVLLATVQRVFLMDGKFEYGAFRGGSTNTDDAGRFALRGEGESLQKVAIVSPDGNLIWPAVQSKPGQEMKIALPKPGSLIVRYDIPGDAPEAKPELRLMRTNMDLLLWKNISFGLSFTVTNGGQILLTNLTPGTYNFRRWKKSEDGKQGTESEHQIVVIEAGRTQWVDMARTDGQRVRGRVVGTDQALAAGGYIVVRSAEATGQPWPQRSRNYEKEFRLPNFDISRFGADGTFETAMLRPGSYTIIANVYPPPDHSGAFPRRNNNPDYVGAAKVNVNADPLPPVTIKLAPALYVDIAGRVVDDETGEPVQEFVLQSGKVNPEQRNGLTWSEGYSGPMQGSGVSPGQFSLWNQKEAAALRFLAKGYLPQAFTRNEIIASRQTGNLQVRMKRGGELHGVVLDHAGRPVVGAKAILASFELGDMPGRPIYWGSTPGTGHTFATTDAEGRFSLRGVEGTGPRVIVVTADGRMVQPAQASGPRQDLKITLPEPATLIVHYDIPGDVAEASFEVALRTNDKEMPLWKDVTLTPAANVPNGGQLVLTNLTPGTYELSRWRVGGTTNSGYAFLFGDPFKRVQSDLQRIVLESGRTQQVCMVRSAGQRVQGRVTGLESITNSAGSFLYVGSATAIRSPLDFKTNLEPCFDAVKLDKNGLFQTALLEPGAYTLVAEVYVWGELPEPYPVGDDEPRYGGMMRMRPQQLAYTGSAKVTVTTNAAPAPVEMSVAPRNDQ